MELGILAGGLGCAAVMAVVLCLLFRPWRYPSKALKVLCYGTPVMVFLACALAMLWVAETIDVMGFVGGCFALSVVLVGSYMVVLNVEQRRLAQNAAQAAGNEDADPIKRA